MKSKLTFLFIKSSGFVLLITATSKFISGSGGAHILNSRDPLLAIPFQQLLWVVGAIELFIALICIFGKRSGLQAGLIAWLATNFTVYRLGLMLIVYDKPCSCLGNITDALHISPQAADYGMKIVLGYLLLGSYLTLFWLWEERRKTLSPHRLQQKQLN